MLNQVVHYEIPADNVEKLQIFYGALFGWQFEAMPGGTEYYVAQPGGDSGGPAVALMKRQEPDQPPVSYVTVESVDASVEKAVSMDAAVVMPKTPVPGMGWFAVLVDPDRNPIGLWEDDPSAA
jgi:hypothetical protein